MILANVRKDVPPKVAHVGEKNQPCSSWCHWKKLLQYFCNSKLPTSPCQLDEQPSVPNKKLPLVFDAAVLDDPDGWLDDEHITAAQHLLQEQMWQACKVHHWSTPEHFMFTKTTHSSSVSMRMATMHWITACVNSWMFKWRCPSV